MKFYRSTATILTAIALLLLPALSVAAQLQAVPPSVQEKLKQVRREVAQKKHTFSVGYSSAMEFEIDEITGLEEPKDWLQQEGYLLQETTPILQALPSSFDWRTQGGVTPIRNQGNCGSCWSFGTVAPLEAAIKIQTGQDVDLAEQYLISCNMEGWGCTGGWWAHDYHLFKALTGELPGAVLESAAPYKAADMACAGPYQHPYKLSSWSYVAGQPRPSVQAIKNAIYTYGTVAAAVYVGPKFQAYSSGIFDANEVGQVNHAIALVGWVDDLGLDNGYWILRNSWGSSWGEQGYMRIRYGKNDVGYGANYVVLQGSPEPPPPVTTKPDLTGAFGTVTTYYSGTYLAGSLSLKNIGAANAGPFKVILYLSKDGVSKDTALGTASLSSLGAGATTSLSIRKQFSSSVRGRYLLAVIDSDGQVAEQTEKNNTARKIIP